jgi:hypothetical protein
VVSGIGFCCDLSVRDWCVLDYGSGEGLTEAAVRVILACEFGVVLRLSA